jgi:septum formation protein
LNAAVRVVLASASPRRAELLRAAGLAFETLAVDLDEAPRPGEASKEYVRRLAREKAARAQQILEGPADHLRRVASQRDATKAALLAGPLAGRQGGQALSGSRRSAAHERPSTAFVHL